MLSGGSEALYLSISLLIYKMGLLLAQLLHMVLQDDDESKKYLCYIKHYSYFCWTVSSVDQVSKFK